MREKEREEKKDSTGQILKIFLRLQESQKKRKKKKVSTSFHWTFSEI